MNKKNIRERLEDEYLDWFDDYLTVEKFAEHRAITIQQATTILELGREFHERRIANMISNMEKAAAKSGLVRSTNVV